MQGLLALQRYFDFRGRSARAEFWQFMGMFVLALAIALILDLAFSGPYGTPTLMIIVYLGLAVPAFAVSTRRIHDRGRTGKWIIAQAALGFLNVALAIAFIKAKYTSLGDMLQLLNRATALTGLALNVFLLFEFVKRGDDGTNDYGPDPLTDAQPAPTIAEAFARANRLVDVPRPGQPASHARPRDEDPIAQIERLAKLREAGMLTEDEFAQQKAAYLSRL